MKINNLIIAALLAAPLAAACYIAPASADEGMYLFSDPPRSQVEAKYGFTLTKEWLDHAMKASVRFNNGGSGGFVSKNGLVITNHHIADETLSQLSTPDNDLLAKGFLAKTYADELKAPSLELNCLQSIEDVTDRVNSAVKPDMTPAQKNSARLAAMAEIEKESLDKTGLRSDVVTLYHGGLYHLYRYKKYTDVRLVWAPEQAIASFGGDIDNFEYPRRSIDAALFRVYENGRPIHPEHYFEFEPNGPKEGDLVFVSGHPGTTNRQETMARISHFRNRTLPYRLARCRTLEAALKQFSERGFEEARRADNDIHSIANSRKAYTGMFTGLLDADVYARRQSLETEIRKRINCEDAFASIETSQKKLEKFEEPYYLIEGRDAFYSPLFRYARHIVRMADELKKPSAKRIREYRDSNLESLRMDIFADEPIYADLEKAKLAASFSFLAERLGPENSDTQMVLEGKTPADRAAELVEGTKLYDAKERQRLAGLTAEKLAKEPDAMIQLALKVNKRALELRRRYENEVKEPELSAYGQIAQERFKLEGTSFPPDATFTLRLSYGVVKGYEADGKQVSWCTHLRDAFVTAEDHKERPPYNLPESWHNGNCDMNYQAVMDFAATSDTIGGNSGSPVINKDGKLVGVNFDRNQYGMVRNFIYDEVRARHISVSSSAIIEVLNNIYGANFLASELLNQ